MGLLDRLMQKARREGVASVIRALLGFPTALRRKAKYREMLKAAAAKERFTSIYRHKLWGTGESRSGPGSEVGYTQGLREWLIRAIPQYGIRSIVDAPCGDFNWMRLVMTDVDVDYTGMDIVDDLVDRNNERYGSKNIRFIVGDICEDPLADCDLLIVRDCLFHLSYHDIDRFLKNIHGVRFKYLLTTSHLTNEDYQNRDIVTGDFRMIDLFGSPFFFDRDRIIAAVDDCPPGYPMPRKMVLLEKKDVPYGIRG